jgi:6-pyruvoyltetrahydropterin/6-carboxytetrahydropterin synthase
MYKIQKRLEISGAHSLKLDYESKCSNLHGHNWIVYIYLQAKELDSNGMILDFTVIKKRILDKLDHKNLNEIFDFNPTAENIAKWICDEIGTKCYKVTVQESEGNIAEYERD